MRRIELDKADFEELLELLYAQRYRINMEEHDGYTLNKVVNRDTDEVVREFKTYEGDDALIPALVQELARAVHSHCPGPYVLRSDANACVLLAKATGDPNSPLTSGLVHWNAAHLATLYKAEEEG